MHVMRVVPALLCLCFMVSATSAPYDIFGRGFHDKKVLRNRYQEKPLQTTFTKKSKHSRSAKPKLLMDEKPPSLVVANMFDSHVLTCKAGGQPPPTIYWLKDGKIIFQDTWESRRLPNTIEEVDGNKKSMLGLGFTSSRLYLRCLTPYDEGDYTCVAETHFDSISATTTLTVNGLNKHPNNHCTVPQKIREIPAGIYTWTDSRLDLIGNDVQLVCRAAGNPHPDVMWYDPWGTRINSGEKYSILENGDLVIRNISWEEDKGSFTCLAENSYGTDNVTSYLYPALRE